MPQLWLMMQDSTPLLALLVHLPVMSLSLVIALKPRAPKLACGVVSWHAESALEVLPRFSGPGCIDASPALEVYDQAVL